MQGTDTSKEVLGPRGCMAGFFLFFPTSSQIFYFLINVLSRTPS